MGRSGPRAHQQRKADVRGVGVDGGGGGVHGGRGISRFHSHEV
jgi:hypothetical protein